MNVIVIGGGIGGLSFALALHRVGIRCRVYETTPVYKPLGVGLNLLPHAVKELGSLGLLDRLMSAGIETREICFFTRHGQLVDREARGKHAGYDWPQVSIHRADLHSILVNAVLERLGADALALGHRCVGVEQNDAEVIAHFQGPSGQSLPPASGTVLIGCDGIHSAVRTQLHPADTQLRFHDSTQYRGVTRWQPFLTGASMVYVGTSTTAKLVIYPIRNNVDDKGLQLVNWVAEISKPNDGVRDWNRVAHVDEFIDRVSTWVFDWLDVPCFLRAADTVLEYPIVDQDPLPIWTRGRITLLGDAAHPMLPRGSNGSAQAIIDGTTLAGLLARTDDSRRALTEYEAARLGATSNIIHMNRTRYPDAILRIVEERTADQPFERLDKFISQDELKQWRRAYQDTAGFSLDRVNERQGLRLD
jgi:2-polyprenyl-6-methoxyphenol hydroxylase-like FAD-dependent oxidoreductase